LRLSSFGGYGLALAALALAALALVVFGAYDSYPNLMSKQKAVVRACNLHTRESCWRPCPDAPPIRGRAYLCPSEEYDAVLPPVIKTCRLHVFEQVT